MICEFPNCKHPATAKILLGSEVYCEFCHAHVQKFISWLNKSERIWVKMQTPKVKRNIMEGMRG